MERTERTEAAEKRNIVWRPQPKQAKALSCPAVELLYGGAAGGGKTDFLLGDFCGGIPRWGAAWRGVLFRRSYPELEGLLLRAKELYLPLGAEFRDLYKTFTFPNGARIRFASLDREDDVLKFQGNQYTWAGFDELGAYARDFQWTFMMSRLRSAAGAPCYIRGTANPGGPGHNWIKARFIDGREPYRTYRTAEGTTRCYIPATLKDNALLTAHDPGYTDRLNNLPEHLRRAMLDGDWDVFAGQVFDEWRRDLHVVKPFVLSQGVWYKFYAFDWGYQKPYALVKLAVNREGEVVQYGERYGCDPHEADKGLRESSVSVAAAAWADAAREGVTVIVCDPAIWSKADDNPTVAEHLADAGFAVERANNNRVDGWLAVHDLLKQTGEHGQPMLRVFDCCHHTIRTLPALTPDRNRLEDVDSRLEDHLADALRYGVMSAYARDPASALRAVHAASAPAARRYDVLADNGF